MNVKDLKDTLWWIEWTAAKVTELEEIQRKLTANEPLTDNDRKELCNCTLRSIQNFNMGITQLEGLLEDEAADQPLLH